MSDDLIGEMAFRIFIAVASFVIGMGVLGSAYNDALVIRGLKEYDKQTGRLIWTEKAGGEKGGDK